MVDGATTGGATTKSGMDKINESMAKIGSMLGVQPSTSSDGSKKESLLEQHDPNTPPTDGDAEKELLQMNSAEGQVIAPPNTKAAEMPSDDSFNTGHTGNTGNTGMTTKPTMPGKTKTKAGAAIAKFAAGVDNTFNKVNKSFRNIQEHAGDACAGTMTDGACKTEDLAACRPEKKEAPRVHKDPEEASLTRGSVAADGTTVTEYISIEKARSRTTPKWVYIAAILGLAIVLAVGVSTAVPGSKLNRWFTNVNDDKAAANDMNMSVAFIGNSYLYVNDVPRVMNSISKGRIQQESVINTGAGLGSLLKQGNGMYDLWQTQGALDFWGTWDFRAMMEEYAIEVDEDYQLYDYGMCTVPELLDGYDNYLTYKNKNGIYFDVGTNPCFEDQYYMTIVSHKYDAEPVYWDYVVINDQTRRMASEEGREDSINALAQAYASLIKTSRAVPIIVDTHAFIFDTETVYNEQYYEQTYGQQYDEEDEEVEEEDYEEAEEYAEDYADEYGNFTNATSMDEEEVVDISSNIPAFQAAIYEGLYEYVEVLKYYLPTKQAPKIAKIGLTYLAIYDDNRNMYEKLFAQDGIHASQTGTYLFACVLYCTIYGHLPLQPHDDFDVRSVFFKSRSMFGNNTAPSVGDVNYLRYWARRVVVDGFIPKSMVMPTVEQQEDEMEVDRRNWWNQTVYCDEVEEGDQGDEGDEDADAVECVEREEEDEEDENQ